MPNSPISASGLNRNPQNIYIYSSGYDPTPSLTSNHFSIFEIASILKSVGDWSLIYEKVSLYHRDVCFVL